MMYGLNHVRHSEIVELIRNYTKHICLN